MDCCCHSNLTRAVAEYGLKEEDVHDVLNAFMCTGFTRDTNQYFSKPSPVRVGDYIEFLGERGSGGGRCGRLLDVLHRHCSAAVLSLDWGVMDAASGVCFVQPVQYRWCARQKSSTGVVQKTLLHVVTRSC
jgi:hypothetical protein